MFTSVRILYLLKCSLVPPILLVFLFFAAGVNLFNLYSPFKLLILHHSSLILLHTWQGLMDSTHTCMVLWPCMQPVIECKGNSIILQLSPWINIQLMKIQDFILDILVTALLECIDLFIAVFDAHGKII